MAELTQAGDGTVDPRPFPPGDYPVVVVGSGAGAIQVSYSLRRNGVDHAIVSADPAPGGMFRRWPFFQRLLSWTKPFAPVGRDSPAYQRYDWNSLLGEKPGEQSLMPDLMDGSSYFPSRPEMEQNIALFVERTGLQIRYDCRWTGTRREDGPDGGRFILVTTDGEYRAKALVFAVGVAEPYSPSTPGIELAAHYADTRPVETYAGKRIFIMGKQNSGFELATGLLPWARRIILCSPSPPKLSVNTKSLVGVRARYVQPFEDHVLGGGVSVLDASIGGIARGGEGSEVPFVVTLRPSDGSSEMALEVDEVISATGFVSPLLDLPDLGVATFGQARLPAQTPYWESATVPGIFFGGTIGQGSPGLKKHGQPANSGAVHGARYNARVLAGHIARQLGAGAVGGAIPAGSAGGRPGGSVLPAAGLVDTVLHELTTTPELWHQRAYLAKVISLDPSAGARDAGIVPLAAFVDGAGDDGTGDALAITLEADGSGAIYPVLYLRQAGRVDERVVEVDALLRYDTLAARERIASILREGGVC